MLYNLRIRAAGAALLFAFASCSTGGTPTPEYRIGANQLTWQGYRQGEELTFENSQGRVLRTYRITEVNDRMVDYPLASQSAFGKNPPKRQRITVTAQRTDITAPPREVLDFEVYAHDREDVGTEAVVRWDDSPGGRLPLHEINQNQPFNPQHYTNAEVLPALTFGSTTYTEVIHLTFTTANSGILGSTRQLYYVRGKGVVAFEEDGTGLWYRI